MAYNALNNLIDAYIYANGVQAITGQILNGVLKQMVSQLGSGYHLMGVAGPETVPASNDYAMAYFAATAGEYTDFGGITLAAGEVAVLLTYGNGSWSKQTIYNVPTGTADLENTADFITNAVTDLVNYYTKTEVDDTLANYPTLEALATALADYYTKQEIDTTLEGYPTKQDQETALGDYYTKDEMDAALADRYTKSETDTKLEDYYKKVETYDKDEVDSIVAALSRQEYIVAWDGLAAPDVSAIPAGVTVTYSGTTYTGTLAASASTMNKIQMVWNGTAYDMYGTSQDGGYSWVPMGTTTVDLSQYATKAELSQLEAKVDDLEDKTDTTIVHTRNLADSASVLDGLYPDSNGALTANASTKSIKFPCNPSTTYTITKVVTNHFRVAYFNNEPAPGVQGAGTITQNSADSITITTAADSTYIVAFVYDGSSESKTMEQIMASLQIEVGSTATEYVAPGWIAVDKDARENITTINGRIETIEESVSNNSGDISELQDAVLHSVSGVDSAIVNTGKYRVITGELADSTAYFYTDPIRLYKGDKIVITSAAIVASCSAISLLDANGDYVSTIYAGQGETASYTYTAQEDVLVELSALNSEIDCFAIDRNGILNRLSLDEGRIDVLENTIQDKTFGLDGVQVTTGAYRNSGGTISSLNGYYYTEPIKLHKGDSVFTDISISTLSAVAYVTEVDSLGNFVSVLKAGSGEDETISVTIEKDCYVSISSVNSKRGNFFFTRNGLSTRMDILSEGGTEDTIDPATKLPAIGENPLSTIRRDAGYGSIIRKWGIIGDSLSSGEMQCYNEESTSSSDYKFIDMYQYSTGQVLARLLGAEAYNFSNGGQTTWGWLKSQGVVRDETYIGGVGGGDWRLAQQSEYIKDGYIIAMGVNDRGKIANGDYELGTTSQISTYNGTDSDIDDTTTYPKSFVRYYAGIIQRILSVQPKAKIFCVTPLGNDYAEIAQAIRDIVTYFGGNVYLMDIREYIPDGYDVAGFKLQGHLSPMGYAYWAYMYNTYIDWIIRNNGNAFRDTALIGTDYRPDYS